MSSVIFNGQPGGNQVRVELNRLRAQIDELSKKLAAVQTVISYHMPSAAADLKAAVDAVMADTIASRQPAGQQQQQQAKPTLVNTRFRA